MDETTNNSNNVSKKKSFDLNSITQFVKNQIENTISLIGEGELGDIEWIFAQVEEDLKELLNQKSEINFFDEIEKYVKNRINTGLIGWNHPMFDNMKKRQQEQDDYILNPFEVEEGVVQCINCGSKRVFSTTIQTRAADEPMTTIAHCIICKTKWSQNG